MNSFREKYPIAWQFHKNTSRSMYSIYNPTETQSESPRYKEYPRSKIIDLNELLNTDLTLFDALQARHSCRNYIKSTISTQHLATLLSYSYGVRKNAFFNEIELFERFAPSGGGLYPIEFYIIVRRVENLESGIYHYCIQPNVLEQITVVDLPDDFITSIFMNQYYITNASAIIIATAVVDRTMWKYGDRGYRYILLEAGHVFENLNLIAGSLGLGTLNLGGFFDEDIASLLQIKAEAEIPIYALALGVPDLSGEGKEVFH